MAISTVVNQQTTAPSKYRTVTTTDSTTVNAATFTGGTIPILPVTGMPNAFITARFTQAADSLAVTPVYLNVDQTGTVTILGFGVAFTLTALTQTDGTIYYSANAIASTYGSRSSQALGAGLITHMAWLVTTGPAASTTLYAWLSG